MNNGKIGMAMLIALSLGLLVSAASVQAADDVVINEIMYAPSDAFGGTYNEWVELYNNDTVEVNITGWAIDDKTIPAVTMQPGDYAIIAKNDTKFADYYPDVTCTVVKAAISLRNDGEVLCLNDSSESMVDDADFTGCADLANKNNKTLERNATGSWEESLVDGGTPCAENSVLDEGSSTPTLAVSADPASVTVDEETDITFTVTSDDAAIENALVTLSGCGIDANGITGTDGTVVISVTATSNGTIDVTATKDGYDDATTSVTAEDSITPTPTPTSVLSISDASVDAVGETATVNITADGVTDLANFDVTVTYDPAVVVVTDAANDAAFGVAVTNLETAANGTVRLASLNFGDGQTGDGILISTLTLEATGEGTTALTLAINELKDSAENAITVSIDDGEFTVGGGTPSLALAVSADAANVTVDAQTDVTFTVTSDGAAIDGALVTLSGCGVDANGTTGADGTVVISVTATSNGTIDVTATKDGYDDATTSVTAEDSTTPIPTTSVLSISDGAVDNIGDTCEVTITADGVTDLANFDVTVTYDPAVVVVTDAANDAAFGVAVTNLENAANGEVRLASLNFGDGQTGDGILISTLTLEATGEGTTALTLAINELKDSAE
ncbi:MAG: lamin tail domain-containing protein, partial [Euryarchaeota archaeon]|nr:lamin tail domain-containing protein [Euryarchaeota archaeon]